MQKLHEDFLGKRDLRSMRSEAEKEKSNYVANAKSLVGRISL